MTVESANASSNSLKKPLILTENDGVPGSKFLSDPENYTVDQLKRWLKCRGLKLSGKRGDLLSRVRACIINGDHDVLDPSIDGGKWFQEKEQLTFDDKENKPLNIKVPEIPSTGWKKYPSRDIPSQFNYGHIHYYGLESLPARTHLSNDSDSDESDSGLGHMTDKPFKNGRKYVDSDFVHDMTDNKTNDYYYLRAHVWPSMKTELPHNVLVILSAHSGAVIHASCEPCKAAALGRCSHVIAVLLKLLDYVKEHGHVVSTPCTSQDCAWNKGKKRKKNPKRISDALYPNKKRKASLKVIDFDPRPPEYRQVKTTHINDLVKDLQTESAKTGKLSMWLTQLQMSYSDYNLDNVCLSSLREKINILINNISPPSLMQIKGTEKQSESEAWHCERWFRLTASKCSEAVKLGKLIVDEASSAASKSKDFIESNVWKLSNENYQSIWMAIGLKNEPKAIAKYQEQTNHCVETSGLWVNPKYPWIACSPDGLVGKDGLIEIKSLKLFHEHSIQSVVDHENSSISKDVLSRQCFYVKDNKCHLKHSHAYFFQVQMQLLVTERSYCDFVLYAKDGPVSIERIFRDESLISDILTYLTAVWMRVIAPEIFEMRVPRNLLPFVLPETIQPTGNTNRPTGSTNPPTTNRPTGSTKVPTGSTNPTTGSTNPPTTSPPTGSTKVPTGSTNPTTGSTNPPTTNRPTGSTKVPTGSTNPTTGSTNPTTCSSSLIVLPWGCSTSTGITLTNTCPLDNWIMIFQSLVKSNILNLDDLSGSGELIKSALFLLDWHQYGDAKLMLIPQAMLAANTSTVIDLYGNEADFFLPLMKTVLNTELRSTCTLPTCPLLSETYKTCNISLGCSHNMATFESSLHEWLHPGPSPCHRRFNSKPHPSTPFIEDSVADCNGQHFPSWYCSGTRKNSSRQFCNFKGIFIFSVDLLSRAGHLTWKDLPPVISLNSTELYLHSLTLWNGSHYISMINHFDICYLYDGLKEHNVPNSGVTVFTNSKNRLQGYIISHVVYVQK